MRRLFAAVILICLLYFICGYVAVRYDYVSREDYFAYAGIVGSLASVVGLITLTRPPITKNDIQEIEVSALKSMAKTAEDLQHLQEERSKTQDEIGTLAVRKKEMELLVRKASIAIFLREQLAHYERKILGEVSKNSQLQNDLAKAREASEKLSALNEEIDGDPNADYLQEIISSAISRTPTFTEAVSALPPFARLVATIVDATLGALFRLAGKPW